MEKESSIGAGIFYFLDNLWISVSGWLFWILISKFYTSVEVGYSTTIISLVSLISGLLGFGLEFVLLKEAGKISKSFYTLLLFELIFHIAAIPVLYLVSINLYEKDLASLIPIASVLLIFYGGAFVTRHTLLGKMESRTVFLWDLIVVALRFAIAFVIILGTYSIIGAFLAQQAVAVVASFLILRSKFVLDGPSFSTFREQMKNSIANIPTKYTRLLFATLSVVLVAAFVSDPVQVAAFYIAVMIITAIGGFSYSISLMAVPASMNDSRDQFGQSLKVGLVLVVPFIALTVSSPQIILSIINPDYVLASNTLVILAFSIIPSTLVNNTIMKLNRDGKTRLLALMGLVEIISFIILLVILTPYFGLVGASIAILLSVSSTIPLIYKEIDRKMTKSLFLITSIVILTLITSLALSNFYNNGISTGIAAISMSLVLIFLLRIIDRREISSIMASLIRRS